MAQVLLQPLHDQLGTGLDLALVGVAGLLHVAPGHAVGAEEHVGRCGVRAGLDLPGDQPGHGADVAGVVVVAADAADRQAGEGRVGLAQALQLTEAGAAGADREVGVKGQHHHLVHVVGLDVAHRRLGEGMPVAHGHVAGGLDAPLAQAALQLAGLLLGDAPQGRATADRAVGLLRLAGPQAADQPGQGLLQGRIGQPDDLGIGEQVVEERTHVLDPLRPSQIQQQHANLGHAFLPCGARPERNAGGPGPAVSPGRHTLDSPGGRSIRSGSQRCWGRHPDQLPHQLCPRLAGKP